MFSIFDNKNINSGRQIEWDYAKVFSMVIMIIIHFFAFCTFGILDYKEIDLMFIFLQFSAPIFMYAMGIGMMYTRHDSPREFIIRGIKLLLTGLIINTMYFLSNYGAGVPLQYSLLSFLANDILQFAGLSFIVIGIFKKFNLSLVEMFLIAMVCSLVVTYHPDITVSNIYLNQFLGNFIETVGDYTVSCFPIVNWLIVPVSGMLTGSFLKRCRDKDEFYKRILRPTSIMVIILLFFGFLTLEGMFSTTGGTVPEKLEYLHIAFPDIAVLICEVLFFTSAFYFISKKTPKRLDDFVIKSSKNITIIYIIQWAIILGLTYINQFWMIETNLTIAFVTLIFILAATWLLSDLYVEIKDLDNE